MSKLNFKLFCVSCGIHGAIPRFQEPSMGYYIGGSFKSTSIIAFTRFGEDILATILGNIQIRIKIL